MQITYFGATDIGRVRTNNEDTFIARPIWGASYILLAAIDGMGGEEGGEVAAETARKTIIEYLEATPSGSPLTAIKDALAQANNAIVKEKQSQPKLNRMGCVATAGIFDIEGGTLSIAHVGDSRLYRFSNGELVKLTHDHSLVGYQEEQGILTEIQAMNHPRRSVIERCLGADIHQADDPNFIEGGIFPITNGETYIFCSDGLSDVLTSAQIAECLEVGITPEQESASLIAAANKAGGKDNITLVVAQISDESKGKGRGKYKVRPRTERKAKAEISIHEIKSDKSEESYDRGNANTDIPRRKSKVGGHVVMWLVMSIIMLAIGYILGHYIYPPKAAPVPQKTVLPALPDTILIVDSVSIPTDSISHTDTVPLKQNKNK